MNDAFREDRNIRVFVSSTFRDMQEERDVLVKYVFPQLRERCQQRGVGFTEVDLRWGVTEEQAERGEVIPVCLTEIDRCRPFFIGLLGERYGWVPGAIPRALLEAYPWLADYPGRSVTELEVIHGVLADPARATHARFYFRAPDAATGSGDLTDADPASRAGLAALKDRIRASGVPLREGYADTRQLGEWILADLGEVIDREFPPGPEDPLDREAVAHEMFARSRTRIYVPRPELSRALGAHATGSSPPLLVLGASGLGKSALLADWGARHRRESPDVFVLTHFIGATAESADWAAMLQRLMGELNRRFHLGLHIPDDPAKLRTAFASALAAAAAAGRAVLVIDGLNQLEDHDGALDLTWLPTTIPAGVRLIVSTLPGRPLEEARKRGWPSIEVTPLGAADRDQLVRDYLGHYAKRLDEGRSRRLAACEPAANPLYLRAVLEELRMFGVHERLDEQLDHYLASPTPDELFQRILARYERDYDPGRSELVRDAFSFLWAARRGLTETELLALLGTPGGKALPRAVWSPLALAAGSALIDRAGLLGFSHDYFRRAVEARYLSSEAERRAAHSRLAQHFGIGWRNARSVVELPWHAAEAGDWATVHGVLTDMVFFRALWGIDRLLLKALWARMEAASPYRLADAYRPVVEDPRRSESIAWAVATLLHDTGHPAEAAGIRRFFVDECRKENNPRRLAGAIGQLAHSAWAAGDLDTAEVLGREWEQICREIGDEHALMLALGSSALVARARGDLDRAMGCNRQVEEFARRIGDDSLLSTSLANLAAILLIREELDQAAVLLRESERLCQRLGDRIGLRVCLTNQATVCRRRGDAAGAVELGAKAMRICHELGDADNLRACENSHVLALNDLAGRLAQQNRMPEALRAVQDSATLAKQLGLTRLAEATDLMLNELKKPTSPINQKALAEAALKLIDECRSAGMGGDMAVALAICDMLRDTLRPIEGDPWPPGKYFRGRERFLRGMIHVSLGDVRGALALFEESVALFESLAAQPGFEWLAEDLAAARGNRDRARGDGDSQGR